MGVIRNYSEYDVICEALTALDMIADQEHTDKVTTGCLYKLLTNLVDDYSSVGHVTSEQLFKDLGYVKTVQENFKSIIYYSTTKDWHSIVFYLDTHEVKLINNEDKYVTVNTDLNKAIQLQLLELGW